jgi:hypothetical protein
MPNQTVKTDFDNPRNYTTGLDTFICEDGFTEAEFFQFVAEANNFGIENGLVLPIRVNDDSTVTVHFSFMAALVGFCRENPDLLEED